MAQDYGWGVWRKYGADGLHGADALAHGIEKMVTGITSSPHSKRGWNARLRYLTASKAGREAMAQAGISKRALAAWTAGKRSPSPRNRTALDRAYWSLRRRRVVPHLKRRLADNGRGTRIEIDPVDQRGVAPQHRRSLPIRHLTLRPHTWNAAVDAWIADDRETMKDIWERAAADIGSDYDAYTYVSSLGWAA